MDVEFQLEENFYNMDKENFENIEESFISIEQWNELSYVEKKLKLIDMKENTLRRNLLINKQFNQEDYKDLKEEKEFILAQLKNLHQFPYSFLEPMFETSDFYSERNKRDFIQRINKINKWHDSAYFDLKKYYNIPNDMNVINYGGILHLKQLNNIVGDDVNLDVIKFTEILSLAKIYKKDNRNILEKLFDSMF